jgi:predicted dehydrogenase
VEVPTHIAGLLDFSNGQVGTIITSFDVWKSNLPRIEIYGSEGYAERT